MSRTLRVAVAFLTTFGAGFIASLFVSDAALDWYASLAKPAYSPPNWLFFPVWLALYALMAVSLALMWLQKEQNAQTEMWVRFYFVQLLFNTGWPVFFFGFRAPLLALIDIGFLIFVIVCLMISAWEIDRRIVALFTPYLTWVTYAAFLNALIWSLNA